MLKSLLLVGLGLLLSSCGADGGAEEPRVSIQDTGSAGAASELSFQDMNGNAVDLSDFRGKNVLVNFWATWCAPCIREIPSLARAAEKLGNDQFTVLLGSYEEMDDIREFIAEHDFQGSFIKLNDFFTSYGLEVLPSTVLYDAGGKRVATWVGAYEWDEPRMLSEITRAVGGPE